MSHRLETGAHGSDDAPVPSVDQHAVSHGRPPRPTPPPARTTPLGLETSRLVHGLGEAMIAAGHPDIAAFLEEDRERQRRIVEELPAIAYVCDVRTNANVWVSREFFRTLGITAEEEVRAQGDRLLAESFHPDDVPAVLQHAAGWPATPDGVVRETRFRMRHRDGTWRWLRTRELVYARDATGAPSHIIGFAVDETAQRHSWEALVEQQAQLDYAQAIARMGSWSWHPGTGVVGWSRQMYELWGRDPRAGEPTVDALLATIPAHECDALLAAVGDAFGARAPSVELEHTIVRPDGSTIACHCRGVVEYHRDGSPARVTGTTQDVTEARRIVDSLRETEERYRLALAASDDAMFDCVVHPEPRLLWNHAVRDTGHGIPRALLERIFEPFFTTKPVGEGTGMGLAVVHGIVHGMGGTIDVESTEGRGTTVTLHLPRHVEAAAGAASVPRLLARGAGRILVVDDEPAIRRLLQVGLERRGFVVVTAGSPGEALAEVRRLGRQLDALVTDQTMPGMTGDLLIEAVRAVVPDLPALLMTGYSHRLSAERVAELGATLLHKPAELDVVADALADIIAARGLPAGSAG